MKSRRLVGFSVLTAALLGASLTAPSAAAMAPEVASPAPDSGGAGPGGEPQGPTDGERGSKGPPWLVDSRLREAVERLSAGRKAPRGVETVGNLVRVEALLDGDPGEARRLIVAFGGVLEGEVPGVLIQALVPFDDLVALERSPSVLELRPPLKANVLPHPIEGQAAAGALSVPVIGQEVGKTNADAWHAAGFTGAGVRIGIVDYFSSTFWDAAVAAGELPTPAGTFCRENGSSCDVWKWSGERHGTAVAEVIHEMAPGAQLYIAWAWTAADLQAAVNYFASQGVDVISRSLTAFYDGPGDGTGPIAAVIDSAVSQGMAWFNSAGNSAGKEDVHFGSYWRGQWSDPDGDGWLNFSGTDEHMGFFCAFINGVRWSDWGSARTDYDVYVYDELSDVVPESSSTRDQTAGATPLEWPTCGPGGDVDYMRIKLYDAGAGTAGDVLEFMTNGPGVEYWQNPYSASGPASDTASSGGVSVGAIDPPLGTTIASYSSWGPTNDERVKPDLSAAACVDSFTYSPDCFNGTSAATPAAADRKSVV